MFQFYVHGFCWNNSLKPPLAIDWIAELKTPTFHGVKVSAKKYFSLLLSMVESRCGVLGPVIYRNFTPSLGIPFLGVKTPRYMLEVKIVNHLSLLMLGS